MNDWEEKFWMMLSAHEANILFETGWPVKKALRHNSREELKNFIRSQKELSRRGGIESALLEVEYRYDKKHQLKYVDLAELRSKLLPKDE
jgi:hypothetical protein